MFQAIRASIAAVIVTGSLATTAFAAPGKVCYFDDCGAAPAQSTTAPGGDVDTSRKVAQHGPWVAIADGDTTVIMDRFEDGAAFGVAYSGQTANLVMFVPKWQMHKGDKLDVKIDVDGDVFKGKGEAISETTIMISNVGGDFTREFYQGRKVQAYAGGDTFTMTTLEDASATLEDAKLYRRTSAQ